MPESRLTLERWALGELSLPERLELEERARHDAALAERMDAVSASIENAARGLPSLDLPTLDLPIPVPTPHAGPSPVSLSRTRAVWVTGVALGLAAGALFVLGAPAIPEVEVATQDVRFRGGLDVEVVRIRDGRASPLDDTIRVRAGDRVQYQVTAPRAGVLQVFDVQDDGETTLWLTTHLGAMESVDGAAVLDGYAGGEHLLFVLDDLVVTVPLVKETE